MNRQAAQGRYLEFAYNNRRLWAQNLNNFSPIRTAKSNRATFQGNFFAFFSPRYPWTIYYERWRLVTIYKKQIDYIIHSTYVIYTGCLLICVCVSTIYMLCGQLYIASWSNGACKFWPKKKRKHFLNRLMLRDDFYYYWYGTYIPLIIDHRIDLCILVAFIIIVII